MAQSKKYITVKRYYDMGMWSIGMVANAVVKDWITAEEYKKIVGEEYTDY